MAEQESLGRQTFGANETIFREGDAGHAAFIVETGTVEISKPLPGGGPPLILGHIGPGGIFGEMALIDSKPRMAQAKALDPTTLIVITEAALQGKLRRTDPFVRGLLSIFVRNIRNLTEQLVSDGGTI